MIALVVCSLLYLVLNTFCLLTGIDLRIMTPMFALVLALSQLMSKKLSFSCIGLVVLVNCLQTYLGCGVSWQPMANYFLSSGVWYFIIPVVYRHWFKWEFLSDLKIGRFCLKLAKVSFFTTVGHYLISNLVCWLQMSEVGAFLPEFMVFKPYFYAPTWAGLLGSYLMALPYYARQLFGTFVFFGVFLLLDRYQISERYQKVDRWYSLAKAGI